MAKIDAVDIPKLLFTEGAAPGTPPSGKVHLYAKADGLFYSKDDAGVETVVTGGPSSSGYVAKYKNADESVANTTLQNDDDLLFPIAASEKWVATWHLFVTNVANTGDIKILITAPSGATVIRYGIFGADPATTSTISSLKQQAIATAAALSAGVGLVSILGENLVIVTAFVENGATPGNVTLQWAQNATDGTNATIVKKGSHLVAHKVA